MGVLRVGEVGIAWEAVGRVMDEGGGIGVTEVIGKVLWGGVLQSANRGVACVGAGKRSEEILLLDSSMEMIIFQHKRFILQPEITTQLSLPTDKCGRIGPLSADTHPTLGIAYLGQSSAVISYSLMVTNKVKVVFGKQSHNFELEPAHSMADLLRAVGSKFNLVAQSFVLKVNLSSAKMVNHDIFEGLREQKVQFTLYVVLQQVRGELEASFRRLNLGQNNENSSQFQVSFDQTKEPNPLQPQPNHSNYADPKQQQKPEQVPQKPSDFKRQYQRVDHEQVFYMWPSVQCDICFVFPIKGTVFKCLVCKEFDLCSHCELHYHRFHPLLQIDRISHYPTQIDVLFSKSQEGYMNQKLQQQKETIKEVKKVFYQKDEQPQRFREINPLTLKSTQVRSQNFAACLLGPVKSS